MSGSNLQVAIAGAGAAGYFAAIACAEANPIATVHLLEATDHCLAKVRVSGGGRCNVTHACFEPSELVKGYPRGSRELLGPFHRFGPRDTVAWFAARGVELKTEPDNRMFPVTDRSETIAECLEKAASKAGVRLRKRCPLTGAVRSSEGFELMLTGGETVGVDRLLLATGGTRGSAGLKIASGLGHAVIEPVPSLFTFHIDDARLVGLEGISVSRVCATIPGTRLKGRGGIVVTHWGLSGPAVLKLSAWGARHLHAENYQFKVAVNWADERSLSDIERELSAHAVAHARQQCRSSNPFGIASRLWERLISASGVSEGILWAHMSKEAVRALAAQVGASEFQVTGKSMNKEEFVTCGGVSLSEIDFATMESRIVPGLHLAGEVIDVDGITGGFNFQAAWTTGWHAGRAMAAARTELDKV